MIAGAVSRPTTIGENSVVNVNDCPTYFSGERFSAISGSAGTSADGIVRKSETIPRRAANACAPALERSSDRKHCVNRHDAGAMK